MAIVSSQALAMGRSYFPDTASGYWMVPRKGPGAFKALTKRARVTASHRQVGRRGDAPTRDQGISARW
jgi:hypothetical protein